MKVSVAMATCEGERFLEEQLESISAQSRTPDELVVFDDASEDSTFERLERFSRTATFPVRLHRNDARLGITRNFERAIGHCEGDVILLADQDDVWLPPKIETLCGELGREPRAGAVFCNGEIVDELGAPLGTTLWKALGFDPREQRELREGRAAFVFLRHVVAAGTTLAFEARHRPCGLPFPELRSCHDAFLAFVIAARAPVRIVEAPLVRYRLHGGNQVGIRRLNLFAQLQKAREQVDRDAFGYEVEFFERARERLGELADVALREALDEKIAHARCRRDLPDRGLERLATIRRELFSGRYRRYSYGWKSAAQDLWLR